jgi:hypothetical protein
MISHKRGSKLDHREPSKQWSTGPRCMELWACWMVNRISCTAEHDGAYLMVPFIIFWPKEWPAGIFISIFLGSTSCDFQWSYRAIYIHEHNVEQEFQLSHPGIHRILIIQGWIRKRQAHKKNDSNFQHFNVLSAYEVKNETSTSSTYVSLVFYCIVRS